MHPNTSAITYHLLVSATIAYLVSRDSLSREGKLPHWGYLLACVFNLWAFAFPFYFAKRRLFEGEVRRGGYYWNVCRSFTLLWTLLFFSLFFWSFVSKSWRISDLDGMEFFAIVAASGMIYSIWVGGVSVAAVLGFVLRDPDAVENGAGAPIAPASVPRPTPSGSASAPSGQVMISVMRNGVSQGDFTEAMFKSAIQSGVIVSTDHYWTKGMKEWRPVSEYPNP
jgi:hypothetical protein